MPLTYAPTARVLDADPPLPDGTPSGYAAWTSMLDAKQYIRAGLAGLLVWEGTMLVSGTALLPFIQIGPITAVSLYSSTTTGWHTFSSGVVNLGVGNIEGAPGTLALNTWYYVYVYATPGGSPTLGYEISTFPPHAAGVIGYKERYKQGQTNNYLLLGSFRTNGAGNPYPLVKRAGVCTYAIGHGAAGATGLPLITSAVYAATTTLPNFIPPHANAVDVMVYGIANGAAIGSVQVQPAYGFGAGTYYLGVGVAGTPDTLATWRIPLLLQGDVVAARQNLQAVCLSGGVIPTCSITVAGWPE